MSATASRKSPASRKSLTAQVVFVVVLLVVGRVLWTRDQPERLRHTQPGDFVIVADTMVTLRLSVTGEPTVVTQSIYGGETRSLTKDDAQHRFYENYTSMPNRSGVVEDKLYYGVETLAQQSANASVGGAISANPVRFLGSFLLRSEPGTLAASGEPQRAVTADRPPHEVRFREVAIRAGTSRDVVTLRGESLRLVGDHVFWIRPAPEETRWITRGKAPQTQEIRVERTAHSDLMLTSLADGVARCIRHGISREVTLNQGNAGVTWQEERPYPGKPVLFYARSADGSVRSLPDRAGSLAISLVYVEYGDRLYRSPSLHASGDRMLQHSKLDGSDLKELRVPGEGKSLRSLTVYRGALYGVLTEAPANNGNPFKVKASQYLCRVYPERADPVEILHKLPGPIANYGFAGDYFYFVLTEKRRSLWASLTADEMGTEITDTLCRFTLGR
jgi:hypothetical protein